MSIEAIKKEISKLKLERCDEHEFRVLSCEVSGKYIVDNLLNIESYNDSGCKQHWVYYILCWLEKEFFNPSEVKALFKELSITDTKSIMNVDVNNNYPRPFNNGQNEKVLKLAYNMLSIEDMVHIGNKVTFMRNEKVKERQNLIKEKYTVLKVLMDKKEM